MKEKHKINLSKHTLPKASKFQVFKFALYAVVLFVMLYFLYAKLEKRLSSPKIELPIKSDKK